jgi:hypothetical protein
MPVLNSVVKYNAKMVAAGLCYLILLIIIIHVLDMPLSFKILTLALILYLVPYFRLIIFTLWISGTLLLGNRTGFPAYASYIFTEHYKTTHNLDELKNTRSTIFVTNYPCPLFNYPMVELLPTNTCVIGFDERYWGVKLFARHYYKLKAKDNYTHLKTFVADVTSRGFNVLAFVEDVNDPNKRDVNTLGRIKSGMFSIAASLKLPIIPIYISVMPFTYGWPSSRTHHIWAGEKMIVQDPEQSRLVVKAFFEDEAINRIA